MDSRERVFLALNFEEPDRVPIDFWMSDGFKRKLESGLNVTKKEFLDAHDVDLRYIEGPARHVRVEGSSYGFPIRQRQ